jgi:hypothetical protein
VVIIHPSCLKQRVDIDLAPSVLAGRRAMQAHPLDRPAESPDQASDLSGSTLGVTVGKPTVDWN